MKNKIIQVFSDSNIPIDEDKAYKLYKFYSILVDYNNKINLTSITKFDDVLVKHFLDSAFIYNYFPDITTKNIIDVGTGAGFPGVVLGIVFEDTNITLLETLNKRCIFLDYVINELKLNNIEVINGRAEDFGKNPEYREKYDYAVSRAVAKLNVLAEYLIPFVREGGMPVCYKGSIELNEINDAKKIFGILGCSDVCSIKFTLPVEGVNRAFIYSNKESATPGKYPRRAGIPLKSPIV